MATQDDLGDFEDGPMNSSSQNVMLSGNTESPALSSGGRQQNSENASESQDDSYLLYDGYDSYGERSDDSRSSTSDSDNDSKEDKPLTYHNGTDLNSIPIKRDGMAVCEKCGAIGVKHAFYSKSKRFCSLACSRSYATLQREGKPIPKPEPKLKFQLSKVKTPKREHGHKSETPVKKTKFDLSRSFDWLPYLHKSDFSAAPVSCFKHAPLSDCWDNITVGMKVEVENRDSESTKELFPKSFWIATVLKIAGFKALLRYEGFGIDNSKDFWINLCSESVHPVGWCATKSKPLIPPKTIQHKYSDWKEFLVKRLTGARTLPSNFYLKAQESLKSRFRPGLQLEVVDKNRISSMRVATVDEVVGGRLHVKYVGADNEDEGFWCHEKSPLIHPVGWSQVVGHSIQATLDYAKKSLQKTFLKKYDENDATWDMFVQQKMPATNMKFKEGMKLEAIDPLNLSTICVAAVMKVLRNNFLMIGIEGYSTEKGSDWFCYHASSPCIFPVGFCELNNIDLTPPRGLKGEFSWFDYLKEMKAVAAPVALFNKELPNHGFKPGMCLEAVDLMEPRLVCVGTVTKVIGRLLRVHFDGWEDTYDQWCDCESPDLYPVGWCEMVGYHLEPPRTLGNDDSMGKKKTRKPKTQIYRGPRKKKKARGGFSSNRLKVNGKTGLSSKVNIKTNDGAYSYVPLNAHTAATTLTPATSSCSSEDIDAANTEESSSEAIINISGRMESQDSHLTSKKLGISSGNLLLESSEEKKEICDVSNVSCPTAKTIPRLIDSSEPIVQSVITPELWSIFDVAQFLRVNDCGAYCDSFSKKRIDGKKFLTLTKEQIVNLTGMKVGPSLKIYDLIQQLKAKVQVS